MRFVQSKALDTTEEVYLTDEIILYSKPQCRQCEATLRKLDKDGVKYNYVDLSEQAEALEEIKNLGYLQAPVVYVNEDVHWSGHRPDLIDKHIVVA